jgi:hypothetical protein
VLLAIIAGTLLFGSGAVLTFLGMLAAGAAVVLVIAGVFLVCGKITKAFDTWGRERARRWHTRYLHEKSLDHDRSVNPWSDAVRQRRVRRFRQKLPVHDPSTNPWD